jgi:uncharacterized glyoxalase superfamily protein PhnB
MNGRRVHRDSVLMRSNVRHEAEPETRQWTWWGRAIFYVDDVDAFYGNAVARGLRPEAPPRDAPWGERYFHIVDPDGHELSFAIPLGTPK